MEQPGHSPTPPVHDREPASGPDPIGVRTDATQAGSDEPQAMREQMREELLAAATLAELRRHAPTDTLAGPGRRRGAALLVGAVLGVAALGVAPLLLPASQSPHPASPGMPAPAGQAATTPAASNDPVVRDMTVYANYLRGDTSHDSDAAQILPTLTRTLHADGSTWLARRGSNGACWVIVAAGANVSDPTRHPDSDCPTS